MNICKIAANAVAFSYNNIEDFTTNVFLIETSSKFFVMDTYCGSDAIKPILEEINLSSKNKEIIVINSHFHWDHVWGNISFAKKDIISHEICRKLLHEQWENQIKNNRRYILGRANKRLPNITFKEKMIFYDEGIELFYSPGHTIDSISLFDHNERVLYAGDNLEKPIIYVENNDINTYIKSLENYLNYKPKKIVAGHSLDLKEEDIFSTIEYLKGLSEGREFTFKTDYERKIHYQNINMMNKK
jgi:hydroxyacylglutathione hydrolase